jgi:pimeloyl-ACP methyl ester carboxylesterase
MVWHKTIGSGPTKVVVIHGWFWDHRAFTPIFDCLDAAAYTFAFPDIRGYGNSRDVSGEYTIGEIAADAITLAEELGWREFHVVGHSMGGKAAQKVAMDAPGTGRSRIGADRRFRRQPGCQTMAGIDAAAGARDGKPASLQELYALLHQG